ncbi:MAG: S-methyl-5-thioribose-1-phosphate isomerase [Candidatus Micrarchaeota archaeon]|nr:S-methyl-5-thioribose-1-phosphate isomerase [Candidatus Micrarchaeota archaeon]
MRRLADITPVRWDNGSISWIDQTRIPWGEEWKASSSVEQLAKAIEALEIRGAPAIGIAAAYGIALAAHLSRGKGEMKTNVMQAYERLRRTRPTAVNLFWALDRMLSRYTGLSGPDVPTDDTKTLLLKEAKAIHEEDVQADKDMGRHGNALVKDGDVILTHCNAGALATGGWGTSYGIIRTAWQSGKDIRVIATTTAPLYQGARLTMWELKRDGIPAKLITDNMAAYAMKEEKISKVLLGADRILMNGTVANKIGTYGLAVLAKYHKIPFYVAAPVSTIDPKGKTIPIEQRKPEEVRNILGRLQITIQDAQVLNPAFDITPDSLVSAIVTERGIARRPYAKSLAAMVRYRGIPPAP